MVKILIPAFRHQCQACAVAMAPISPDDISMSLRFMHAEFRPNVSSVMQLTMRCRANRARSDGDNCSIDPICRKEKASVAVVGQKTGCFRMCSLSVSRSLNCFPSKCTYLCPTATAAPATYEAVVVAPPAAALIDGRRAALASTPYSAVVLCTYECIS